MRSSALVGVRGARPFAQARQYALGTDAVLAVSEARLLEQAARLMAAELSAVDRACSRFRSDAEICNLESRAGEWVRLSPMLFEALRCSLDTARTTGGVVDPTVGAAMDRLGYDRDFNAVERDGPPTQAPVPAPGYQVVELDVHGRRARIPKGVHLDLGATAKALVSDRIAASVAALGTGVVVSVGGDVSIAGPAPEPGWSIGIAADSGAGEIEEVVAMSSGGLATSSTQLRTWRRGGRRLHHVIDPATGDCAMVVWRTVTVAAGCCVEANGAATAAMVWGLGAPDRLRAAGMAARLVHHDGVTVTTPGWPRR